MKDDWKYEDQMIFESDLKDSIYAGAAYFNERPSFKDMEGEDTDEFCCPFFEEI